MALGRPSVNRILISIVIGSGVLMSTISQGSLNISLPEIAKEFDVDLTVVQWLSLSYSIGVISLVLSFSRLADIFGRRKFYLLGYAIFASGSLLSSLMPDLWMIVAARFYQSIGAALVQSTGVALLVATFPENRRGQALGINATFVTGGILLGPIVGGIVTELVSWRANFYLPVPIAIAAIFGGWKFIQEHPEKSSSKFNWLGSILLILSIAPLIFALNQISHSGWAHPRVLSALIIFSASTTMFYMSQTRSAYPLIDFSIFKLRPFSLSLGIALLANMARSSTQLLVPFLLQLAIGVPIHHAGMMMAIIPLGAMSISLVGGWMSDFWGPRLPSTGGLTLISIGMITLGFIDSEASYLHISLPLLMLGIGQGLFMSSNSSSIMGSLPRNKLAIAGGFNVWSRTFGTGLGHAVWGGVFAAIVTANADVQTALNAEVEHLMYGFKIVFICGAATTVLAALLAATRGKTVTPRAIPPANR